MRNTWWILLASLLLGLGSAGCGETDDDDSVDDDDTSVDDDDTAGDDDSAGDDDDSTNDPPVFLNSYDFRLVQFENEVTGNYEIIQGQMDVYVSTTVFRAEMTTSNGQEWEWLGPLVINEERFQVTGEMDVSGAGPFWITVQGNFLAGADQEPSRTCLTGIGEDDELFNGGVQLGMKFAWYACETNAAAAAIDRTGTYSVSATVNADNCNGAWQNSPSWTETWQFDGRLLVLTRGTSTGYGIVSDDGQIFRYSMLEQASPGRSLKAIGRFDVAAGAAEVLSANGYCDENTTGLPGGVMNLDYQ